MADEPRLLALLTRQDGLITRSQLRALGRSDGSVRWALRQGWSRVLPGVVVTTGSALTPRQRLVAALLHTGPDSMISSTTAAAWHGVTSVVDHRVHVLAPAGRHPRSAGFVVVHRTYRPEERPWCRGALTLVSRARAVVDAARACAAPDAALAIVCEAVERRLVTVEALRHELESGPRAGSARTRRAVERAEAGAWSAPEADLLDLLAGCRSLPAPWANPTLHADDGTALPVPDLWFDEVGLAVQVHSRRWHSSPDRWDATVMSDGIFAEYGVLVIGVTPRSVRQEPERVRRRIERGYRAAASRPRPPVIAHPR